MTQRERIKCLPGSDSPRTQAGRAAPCQGIERWAFSGMTGTRFDGRAWLAPLALVVALATVPTERAAAQGAVKSVHKDWQIRCDTPPGAKSEQCALIQSVDRGRPRQCRPDRDRAQDRRPEEPADAGGGAARRAAAVRASGSRSTRPTSAAPASCAACPMAASPRWSWTTTLISKLRTGKTATFIIFQTPEEGIGFPMSLAGFGEGYDKLP